MTADDAWFDEIDLDPQRSSLAMGTRALGDRPWLVADDQRDAELALKAHLCAERHVEVFAALDGTETAGATVEALVQAALVEAAEPDVSMAIESPRVARSTDRRPTALEPAKQTGGDSSEASGADDLPDLHPPRQGRAVDPGGSVPAAST